MDDDLIIIEKELKNSVEKLQNCQSKNKLSSCLLCEKLVNCDIRNSYVNFIYKSMNSKESGGFEF